MPLQTKQNVQVLNSNSKVSEDNVQVLLLYEALNKNAAMLPRTNFFIQIFDPNCLLSANYIC